MLTTDERFMRLALKQALKGAGAPSSTPLTGAVIVSNGRIVSHAQSRTGPPAAIRALELVPGPLPGATIYCNFDPFHGAADPKDCLVRLIAAKPARLVIGCLAPRTRDTGQRLRVLKQAGVRIEIGCCEIDCRELNEVYYKYTERGRPFVTIKFAASLDGRIATSTGDSQWISGPRARRLGHQLRKEHDAVLVGIGTVLTDDPQLNVRLVRGPDPARVILDSTLRIPATARVLSAASSIRTFVAAGPDAPPSRAADLRSKGVDVLLVAYAGPHESDVGAASGAPTPETKSLGPKISLPALLKVLAEKGIASILVEGGAAVITSLLSERLADRLIVLVAPKIIGSGLNAIGDLGILRLGDAISVSSFKARKLDGDVVLSGRLESK